MSGVGKSGKGHPKWGGRKKGTPNKIVSSQILCEKLKAVGLEPISGLAALMPELSPYEQAQVLLGIMPYLFPKKKALEVSDQDRELLEQLEVLKQIPKEQLLQLVQQSDEDVIEIEHIP